MWLGLSVFFARGFPKEDKKGQSIGLPTCPLAIKRPQYHSTMCPLGVFS